MTKGEYNSVNTNTTHKEKLKKDHSHFVLF